VFQSGTHTSTPSSTAAGVFGATEPAAVLRIWSRTGIPSPQFGDIAAQHHDRIAMEWLTPRFGDRVGWLAGAHVEAKRYLVATDPDYATTLSDVSVDSLHHQGGAHVDPAFVRHPWWPDALRLRRYDDAAKVPHGDAASIDDVLVIAERVLAQRDSRSSR
jgi:predicted HD phosphohydrolase